MAIPTPNTSTYVYPYPYPYLHEYLTPIPDIQYYMPNTRAKTGVCLCMRICMFVHLRIYAYVHADVHAGTSAVPPTGASAAFTAALSTAKSSNMVSPQWPVESWAWTIRCTSPHGLTLHQGC